MIVDLVVYVYTYNTATYTHRYKLRPAEQPSNLHVQREVTNTRMPHMYVCITYVCGVTAVDT